MPPPRHEISVASRYASRARYPCTPLDRLAFRQFEGVVIEQPGRALIRVVPEAFLDTPHVLADVGIKGFKFRQCQTSHQRHLLLFTDVRIELSRRVGDRVTDFLAVLRNAMSWFKPRKVYLAAFDL